MSHRIPVKAITLHRVEGPITDCDKDVTVLSWELANIVLRGWSKSAPANGAYDKCDFKVVFDDGSLYEGRYDLEHFTVRAPNLANHVRGFMNYLAGNPPAWMSKQPEIMARFYRELDTCPQRKAQALEARQWLCRYDTGLAA